MKKKTLPKNFEELLEKGDIKKLQSVFDTCDVNARGGYGKQTALAFDNCPHPLAIWLIKNGADIEACDTWGNTPLHERSRSRKGKIKYLIELGADVNSKTASIGTPLHAAADSHNYENIKTLVEAGSKVNELNKAKLTPLEVALLGCSNTDIEETLKISEYLLCRGAKKTKKVPEFVERIGSNFEFHRKNFNPRCVKKVSDALDELYRLFCVAPVPRRVEHDIKKPIKVKSKNWKKQHDELWEMLVPPSGCADTVQGEVIRISDRIHIELESNGGINWDNEYKKMADAFLVLISSGKKISDREISETETNIREIKKKNGDSLQLAKNAVKWVLLNPKPVKLPKQKYKR